MFLAEAAAGMGSDGVTDESAEKTSNAESGNGAAKCLNGERDLVSVPFAVVVVVVVAAAAADGIDCDLATDDDELRTEEDDAG